MNPPDPSLGNQSTAQPGDALPDGIVSVGDALTFRQRKRFKTGDVLCGRYKILGELGQGGMGLVFRCLDEVGGIEVAVKMLPPEVSHDTGEMEEVRENFQMVEKLHHPNICAIKTLERDERTGDYLLVMERVEGVNLRQWRKGRARSPNAPGVGLGQAALPEVIPVLRQIAAALDYAHGAKVVHRDIKPSNVMVGADGSVRVLDFGLAAQIHTSFSRVSQVRYGTSGTGPYMAPEQWRGQRQDGKTDQYALGVLAYELLTGHCPFESHEASVLREAVLHDLPEKPAGLDDEAWAALQRALDKNREERFASCTEFVASLGGGVEPRNTRKTRKEEGRARTPLRAVMLVILLAVLGLGGWGVQRWREGAREVAQHAQLQAAEQAKADQLWSQAREALERNELDQASQRAGELEGLDRARAASLREEIANRVTKKDATAAYGEPKRRHDDDLPKWEKDAEGLEALITRFKEAWNSGELSWQAGEWKLAYEHFQKATQTAGEMDRQIAARATAREARAAAGKAEEIARQAGAEQDAASRWEKAAAARKQGQDTMGQGDFAAAAKGYEEAARLFGVAGTYAQQAQAYGKARKAYDERLAGLDRNLLRDFGGAAWKAASETANSASLKGDEPGEGATLYGQALARLNEAAETAPKAKVEADFAQALKAAQEALAGGQWEAAKEQAVRALALKPGHQEAAGVRQRAEEHLVPMLIVEVMADGRKVDAEVKQGEKAFRSGQALTLAKDATYAFAVSYAADPSGRRWKPADVNLVADWTGAQTNRVVLEEQKEPRPDELRTLDLGGGVTLDLVSIPAGSFMMGSPENEAERYGDEGPQHRVTISSGFWMGKYEVTQEQWQRVMGSNPSNFKGVKNPVEMVRWTEAKDFCGKVGGRLPTEAEWEYACRAGTTGPYAGNLDRIGWYYENSGSTMHPVGQKQANAWGLYDMHGNVWEWCEDGTRTYTSAAQKDPEGPAGSSRLLRGGGWGDLAGLCRSARRGDIAPATRNIIFGFRLVVR